MPPGNPLACLRAVQKSFWIPWRSGSRVYLGGPGTPEFHICTRVSGLPPEFRDLQFLLVKAWSGEGFSKTPINSPLTKTPSQPPPLHLHALREPSKPSEIEIGPPSILFIVKDSNPTPISSSQASTHRDLP